MMVSRVDRPVQRHDDPSATPPATAASACAPTVRAGSRAVGDRHFTLRELRTWRFAAPVAGYVLEVAVLLGIGAALGWMGPFGTFDALGTLGRFAFWMLSIPLVGVPATLAFRFVFGRPALFGRPWPAKVAAAALAAALPGVLIERLLSDLFGLPPPGAFGSLPVAYGSVTVLIAAIGIGVMAITQRGALWPEPAAAAPASVAPLRRPGASPFLDRIPPRLGGNLLHIETEDHYLRVHTDRGSDLVLFRLADALAEIDAGLGMQVHRSHFVARRAVVRVERDGHRTTLLLSDGARVPVSRTFLPALRDAGWL